MPRLLHIAFLTDNEGLVAALENLLREHVVLTRIGTIQELRGHETIRHFDALFCDWSFGTGVWQGALQEVRADCPDLPVVVLSRNGGEKEWVEVIETGAFDLLALPFAKESVLPALEQATASRQGGNGPSWNSRRAKWQVRLPGEVRMPLCCYRQLQTSVRMRH